MNFVLQQGLVSVSIRALDPHFGGGGVLVSSPGRGPSGWDCAHCPLPVAGWSRSTPCPRAGRWSTPPRESDILWTTTRAPPPLKTLDLGLSQGKYSLSALRSKPASLENQACHRPRQRHSEEIISVIQVVEKHSLNEQNQLWFKFFKWSQNEFALVWQSLSQIWF